MGVYGSVNTRRIMNVTMRKDAGVDSNQQRRCASCGNSLSRYNAGARCGTCQRGLKLDPGFWEDPQVRQAVMAWDLGTVCRLVRRHTGLSQTAFARLVSSDQSEISRLERGERVVKDRRKLLQWAQILGFPEQLAGPLPVQEDLSPMHASFTPTPISALPVGQHHLLLPAGQSIATTLLPTLTLPVDSFQGNDLHLGRSPELNTWTRMPTRALVVGSRTIDGATRYFAIDARHGARASLSANSADSHLRIPAAYELDDLTYGILWAVAGFDAALLGDDQSLHAVLPLVDNADLDPVAEALRHQELTPGSLMLIGSQASARYILDRQSILGEAPAFWTRERTGEEAATWLFFSHKLDYLRRTAPAYPGDSTDSRRAFCIPEAAATASPTHERVLLFLAIALMESLGIRTLIAVDPGYADTEGFVLMPRQRVVIANWVRADGISKLAQTSRAAHLRTFADAVGHAGAHSVTAADQARDRLAATADYLGLDLNWLARRCSQLATVGTSPLAQPRSRLLGLEGLDSACSFVAHQFTPQNR